MNNKGFTLIEVMAVIAIIAVVGIIATPSVLSMINSSKNSSYEILIDNIKTGASELYQEKDYMNTIIYRYDNSGRTSDVVSISSNSISINLQTLVGNGFLTGSNNSDLSVNANNRVILEPYDNKDIGMCEIKITKVKLDGAKVCYKVEGLSSDEMCPTTVDFGGDSQCIS